jgi:hypothetical protein
MPNLDTIKYQNCFLIERCPYRIIATTGWLGRKNIKKSASFKNL